MTLNELCKICGNSAVAHEELELHHKFSVNGKLVKVKKEDKAEKEEKDNTVEVQLPTSEEQATQRGLAMLRSSADPVLRMALIDKGLLTTDDLTAAETKIAAMMGQPIESVFSKRSVSTSDDHTESP